MKNLKIRVNNKAESKEVMSLLDMAGYTKGAIDNMSKPCWIAVLDKKQYSDYMLSKSTWYTANPKEITLPELRAMANQDQNEPFLTPECTLSDQYAEIEQVRQATKDNVNHPSHYTKGKVECIDALESATIGKSGIEAVCVANVIKYLWRYEEKNGLEDVKKAQFYLNRLLTTLENNNG